MVNGKFVDEDPGAGTPGSLIPSAWGNAVTDEILAVITDAGLTPDEESHGQLKEALSLRDAAATATQAEAEAGTDNAKRMTPLRVFQAIAKVVKQATETTFGWAKVATQAQTNAGIDDTTIVSPKKLSAWFSTVVAQATETVAGFAKIATQVQTNAGTDDTTIVSPKKLQSKISGVVSGQYPTTPGAQAVFNHNLGVIPFMVEFSFVCLVAEGGWVPGDTVHRGNWYQNSVSTDNSIGVYWYAETSAQVTFGLGSTNILLPTKTTGLRFSITPANWRFVARVLG
nr:hypothetical protein [Pseudomonas taiwanensis]